MIGLSAPTADTSGSIVINEDKGKTTLNPPPSRVSRKQCLDGSVHIDHSGECDGDRTFVINAPNVTIADWLILKNLKKNYTSVVICCREGVFSGPIETLRRFKGAAIFRILVKEADTTVD